MDVICPYCNKYATLTDSAVIYNGISYGDVYLCRPCDAWVGVHKGTDKPLGRLANAELREWKKKAHAAFDPLWQTKLHQKRATGEHYPKGRARGSGYKWLANQLNIPAPSCHIGMFDVVMCQRVVEICAPYRKAAK